MSATAATENDTSKLMGRISAGFLLGTISLSDRRGEPRGMGAVRNLMTQIKRVAGDQFDPFAESFRPAAHALAALILDAITHVETQDTKKRLAELPVPQRLAVELIYKEATGRGDGHWQDELWEIKNFVEHAVATSISGISLEELRKGFDSVVHAMVDEVFENRRRFLM